VAHWCWCSSYPKKLQMVVLPQSAINMQISQ
jgi:hypothetical protein